MKNLNGARVVDAARRWLGTPYLHQASRIGIGCDCLGLVRGVWRDILGPEPERAPAYSSAWAEVDNSEKLLSAAYRHFDFVETQNVLPGDVLVFRLRSNSAAKHCGILSSPTHFIHAYEGSAVVESALSDFWWSKIVGGFRFPLGNGSI